MKKRNGWWYALLGLGMIFLAALNVVYWAVTGKAAIGPKSDAARNALPLFGSVIFGIFGLVGMLVGAVHIIWGKSRKQRRGYPVQKNKQ